MNLTDDDVLKILKLFEESHFDTLQLEYGDLKLAVSKGGYASGGFVPGHPEPLAASSPSPPAGETQKATNQTSVKKEAPASKESTTEAAGEEGLVAIKAPMVGTFYVAPEPGAKAFVSVGANVHDDTTVGLIEVMKVFTAVNAAVTGRVMKCLVEDSQFVEFGQTIFLVRPSGSTSADVSCD
ncbi:MAG: biotin/lipoyl-containing protein [Hyphomicrobiales bacterium]|nr:biotin/lipoyl-containing protein [Hyphomicrobiales bacterium]